MTAVELKNVSVAVCQEEGVEPLFFQSARFGIGILKIRGTEVDALRVANAIRKRIPSTNKVKVRFELGVGES